MMDIRNRIFGRRRGRSLAAAATLAVAIGAAAAPQAFAKAVVNHEFDRFADCPITVKKLVNCVSATVTGGEFHVGSKAVIINKPITLQGGQLNNQEALVPAADGNTLSHTPLKVPGGLIGIEGIGGEVTATTELVGPALINTNHLFTREGTAVTLPIRVKLDNAALGPECFIGSEVEPITLRLTTGTTSPPAPNKPITGSPGTIHVEGGGTFANVEGISLVDNSFGAPGTNGCGGALAFLLNPLVAVAAGLPSTSGHNTAILNQSVSQAAVKYVKKSHVIPKAK